MTKIDYSKKVLGSIAYLLEFYEKSELGCFMSMLEHAGYNPDLAFIALSQVLRNNLRTSAIIPKFWNIVTLCHFERVKTYPNPKVN